MTTKSTSSSGDVEERAAGFVLFREEPETGERLFLVLRHRLGDHWAFPKGRIEPGEGQDDAARRELEEETGFVDVDVLDGFLQESRYTFCRNGRTVRKRVTYFLGRVAEGRERLSHEHTECSWLGKAAAVERLTFDEARRILEAADAVATRRAAQADEVNDE